MQILLKEVKMANFRNTFFLAQETAANSEIFTCQKKGGAVWIERIRSEKSERK